jgi:hypothetical protein
MLGTCRLIRSIAFFTVALWITVAAPAADTLVICPKPLERALGPWLRHRQSQGHKLLVIAPGGDAEAVSRQIRRQAEADPIRWLVLVGDTPGPESPSAPGIATHWVPAKVVVHYGSEPEIPTDNPFADLDGDGIPDIAVGRIPVTDARELSRLLERVIQYEKSPGSSRWQSQVHFIAGVGGFGLLADKAIEIATQQLLGARIPATYQMTMTYGSWRSPYCPDPRQFHRHTLAHLNEGSLFWVYLGHGSKQSLDRVVVPGKSYHILNSTDLDKVDCRAGPPIVIFLSCYTAAYDGKEPSLGERLLHLQHGPIAVYGGSRVTMPYAMAVMGESLLRQVFDEGRPTLGELILHAKREMVLQEPAQRTAQRRLIDVMARTLSPSTHTLESELREHLSLFNLLGDPLLRIPYPEPLTITCPRSAVAGETITLNTTVPFAGMMRVELNSRPGQLTFQPPPRSRYQDNDQWLADFEGVYERANDPCWWSHQIRVRQSARSIEIPLPAAARGACSVRVVLEGRTRWASGASPLQVRPMSEN